VDVQVSTEVNRPVGDVWRFYAADHVRNHPRWDPTCTSSSCRTGRLGSPQGSGE
jgi:hypothetical protein